MPRADALLKSLDTAAYLLMALLRAIAGLQPGQLFPLQGDTVILGRHPDCDIVLESAAVSRQHARIVREGSAYVVEDLQSRNGTYVNGIVVQRQPLRENDELTICDITFVFQEGARPRPGSGALPGDAEATAMLVDDENKPDTATIMSSLDVSRGSALVRLQANPEAKLRALIEVSQTLGRSLSIDQLLPNLLDGLFRIFLQADRGFVVLKDARSGRLVPRALKHRREQDAEMVHISRTVIRHVLSTKEAILSADASSDRRFDMAESIVDFNVRSMMCVPLLSSDGDPLGVIQIDTLDQRNRFTRDDLDVLASVAGLAAISVENAQLHEAALREQALQRELAVAHRVQQGLLPSEPPDLAGYRFFAYYDPAQEIGGDYYDYIMLRDGRVAVVMADVSGKGISASLLMAKLSAEARFYLASEPTPALAVERLNRAICESGLEDRFITLATVVLDPQRHEISVVNAGHLPPLLRRADGRVEAVGDDDAQLPLGIDCDIAYPLCVMPLEPDDAVLLYTDGITEAMNPSDELYGLERLKACLAAAKPPLDALGGRVLDDVKRFVSGRAQSDDMCLTCINRAD